MIGFELDGALERAPEPGFGLPGDRQHEVDRQILETGLACLAHDAFGARRVVPASDQGELAVRERLHPDREPIDAGGAQRREGRKIEVRGIRFERDLRLRGDREACSESRENGADLLSGEQRWRPATEEDRLHRAAVEPGPAVDLASQPGEEEVDLETVLPDAVEVAVAALRAAERNVDVEPESRAHAGAAPETYSERSSARSGATLPSGGSGDDRERQRRQEAEVGEIALARERREIEPGDRRALEMPRRGEQSRSLGLAAPDAQPELAAFGEQRRQRAVARESRRQLGRRAFEKRRQAGGEDGGGEGALQAPAGALLGQRVVDRLEVLLAEAFHQLSCGRAARAPGRRRPPPAAGGKPPAAAGRPSPRRRSKAPAGAERRPRPASGRSSIISRLPSSSALRRSATRVARGLRILRVERGELIENRYPRGNQIDDQVASFPRSRFSHWRHQGDIGERWRRQGAARPSADALPRPQARRCDARRDRAGVHRPPPTSWQMADPEPRRQRHHLAPGQLVFPLSSAVRMRPRTRSMRSTYLARTSASK